MHISDFSGTTLRLRYQLVRRIGYGGMATVYEATDLQIDKRVAVKVLNPQFSHIEDYIARFRQEALSAARIRHPQLVDVTDFGSDDGLVYTFRLKQGVRFIDDPCFPAGRGREVVARWADVLAYIEGRQCKRKPRTATPKPAITAFAAGAM